MTDTTHAVDIITHAIGSLRTHGWCQKGAYETYKYGMGAGKRCMDTALCEGVHALADEQGLSRWSPKISNTYVVARSAVSRACGGRSIISWNDSYGRTRTEVLDALDAAVTDLKGTD